jgi:hypothetical protein
MIGLSLRLALALGLHLRNENSTMEESRKNTLMHTWWSLHSIECLLSTITGRPPVTTFEYCTVPLPRSSPGQHQRSPDSSRRESLRRTGCESPETLGSSNNSEFDKRASTTERYHISRINNSLISQKALLHLYSPLTATQSWEVRPSYPLISLSSFF